MKQIGLGLHNYHDARKHFPSLITYDKNGKPLFSWLVEILPNMEYDTIYSQLHKDEPWDSPHNAIVLGKLQINELRCPRASEKPNHFPSHYLAVAGPGTAWRSEGVVKVEDIRNTSLTVMAVECVDSDKHWAEPYFITVDEGTRANENRQRNEDFHSPQRRRERLVRRRRRSRIADRYADFAVAQAFDGRNQKPGRVRECRTHT